MLPELFRKEGYFTARVGKIAHDAFADAVTWDVSESSARSSTRTATATAKKALAKQANAQGTALRLQWLATDNADKDEPDGATARRIVALIEEHTAGPFFIAAGFHKPHLPSVAPKAYFAMYPPD